MRRLRDIRSKRQLSVRRGATSRFNATEELLEWQQPLRMSKLQQSQLKMKTLFLAVAKFGVGAQHDLQMPRQVFFAEQLGDAGDASAFVG
jgi:hypothetical protein